MVEDDKIHIVEDSQGIYTCVFHSSEREAIDQWMAIIEDWQVKGLWYGREQVYLLVDASQVKGLPLRYLLECLADYNRVYPGLQPPHVRLAYLYAPQERVPAVFSLVARLMNDRLQADYFESNQEEQARAWLLSLCLPTERPSDDTLPGWS